MSGPRSVCTAVRQQTTGRLRGCLSEPLQHTIKLSLSPSGNQSANRRWRHKGMSHMLPVEHSLPRQLLLSLANCVFVIKVKTESEVVQNHTLAAGCTTLRSGLMGVQTWCIGACSKLMCCMKYSTHISLYGIVKSRMMGAFPLFLSVSLCLLSLFSQSGFIILKVSYEGTLASPRRPW